MKKLFFFTLLLFTVSFLYGQESKKPLTILLTGASFASPQNGWFELGCGLLHAEPLNRAIGGEAIANTANRMMDGTLYTKEELEQIDAFVIMQVHDKDVADKNQLKENYTDYQTPFDKSNYAAAFDYVIKRYLTDCYLLKDDPKSRYYQTKSGKPAVIVLCTSWHDARTTYNASIRKLAAKWGFPLVEFDRWIGFSKDQVHPVTKQQISLIYSNDTQKADTTTYGWHPQRGEDKYIQRRMAAIFSETMRNILITNP